MISIISKYRYAVLSLALASTLALTLASCADWDDWKYNAEKPETIAQYEYLDDYKPLKEYLPGFKVSGALSATDFSEKGQLFRLAAHNFDEIVAGNAMKMGSCVSDKGVMDFSTVQSLLTSAEDADVSVYGHCLAWHSQQPVKYLSSLIADKEIEGGTETKTDYEIDLGTISALDGWGSDDAMSRLQFKKDGALLYHSTVATSANYFAQYMLKSNMTLNVGKTYKCVFYVKASGGGDANIVSKLGDWGDGDVKNFTVPGDGEYHEISVSYTAAVASNFMLVQTGSYVGDIYWKSFKVTHEEAAAVEVEQDVFKQTYTDGAFPYYPMGCQPPVVNGSIHFVGTGEWSQFFCSTGNTLTPGDYRAYVRCSGTADGSFNFCLQNGWGSDAEKITKPLTVKEGWNVATINFTVEQGTGKYDFIIQPGSYAGTFDLNYIDVKKIVKMNTKPLTDQEKKDTLTKAMNAWCKAMIMVTGGYVKAWDLINEPVCQNGNFMKDGYYHLQGAKYSGSDDSWDVGGDKFYWQDYLGEEDYGPIVEKAARQAYAEVEGTTPSDLKLFVNDYNLESDWDQNLKLKSLIHWVGIWEQKGAKIDGLGTQMHISYYENETTMASKKAAIQNMFRLMAETGKLVRISELDMGYIDKNDKNVTTAEITEISETHPLSKRIEQEKAMADFYQWIIEQYRTIVPAAQQYGICQWCLTDSPADSSWRGGQPVGIWNQSYQRKPAYGGWAEGLKK